MSVTCSTIFVCLASVRTLSACSDVSAGTVTNWMVLVEIARTLTNAKARSRACTVPVPIFKAASSVCVLPTTNWWLKGTLALVSNTIKTNTLRA